MIIEVEGDILLSQAQVIAHGVASNDAMKQGLALALHNQYPTMHKDFHHWCHQHSPKLGDAWMWGGVGGVRVVNLITQDSQGHGNHPAKATTSSVNRALHSLKKMIAKEGFTSIALPKLATGVGGLEWSDVKPLIESNLGDLEIPIFVYSSYKPNVAAKEKI